VSRLENRDDHRPSTNDDAKVKRRLGAVVTSRKPTIA